MAWVFERNEIPFIHKCVSCLHGMPKSRGPRLLRWEVFLGQMVFFTADCASDSSEYAVWWTTLLRSLFGTPHCCIHPRRKLLVWFSSQQSVPPIHRNSQSRGPRPLCWEACLGQMVFFTAECALDATDCAVWWSKTTLLRSLICRLKSLISQVISLMGLGDWMLTGFLWVIWIVRSDCVEQNVIFESFSRLLTATWRIRWRI